MKARLLRIYASVRITVYCMPALISLNNWSFSQCPAPVPEPDCATVVAPEVFEGVVIGAGETYVVSGPVSLNSITIAGGELIVCSDFTVNTVAFSSGNLSVGSGGTVTVLNGGAALVLGSNCTITNYGTVNLACSIVTGANTVISNATTTSVFAVPFNQIVMQGPNAQFINNGQVQSSFIVNTSNTVVPWCLGAGSQTITGIMINQYNVGFNVPDPTACVNVTNFMSNSAPLTNSADLILCYDASIVTVSGTPNFGNASVFPDEPSCIIPLGNACAKLTGELTEQDVLLSWNLTWTETEVDHVTVMRYSEQTGTFGEVYTGPGTAAEGARGCIDQHAFHGAPLFYKLKVVTVDNRIEYSEVIKVDGVQNSGTAFYPNPFREVLYCMPGVEVKEVYTLDAKACSFAQEKDVITFGCTPANGLIIVYEVKGNKMVERVLAN